ncbi:MAG: hypothetical protein QXO51_04895 [Halobacteria archaeon]
MADHLLKRFQLGGVGCVLALVAAIAAIPAAFTGGSIVASALGLVGAVLILLGVFALKERFQSPLFSIGATFIIVGAVASLAAAALLLSALDSMGPGMMTGSPADMQRALGASAGALVALGFLALLALVGWILIGVGLVTTRQQIGQALGPGQDGFVMATGILVIIPLIQLVGLILLAIVFFKLAKGVAPAASAPPAA